MPKVFIFGVNGFVGGYLADEFASHGYEVAGTDRGETSRYPAVSRYTPGDLSDAPGVSAMIEAARPDVIVNLAAISSVGQSWSIPAVTFQVNVVGTINILEAVRAHCPKAKVLLIGSSEEYAVSMEPLSEESPVVANNPYGASKAAQGNVAEMYADRFGLKVYRTRSFNHIGAGQAPNFVVASWCKQAAEISESGRPGTMRVGNTSVSRDFSDVRDVVRAYRLLVESDYAGEVFNVGAGQSYPLSSILETITGFSDQPITVEVDPALLRPADNPVICSDCTKAERLLGWKPEYSIEQSLRAVFDSFCTQNSAHSAQSRSR